MPHAQALQPPVAVLFDAYGTLFDVYSVGFAAEQLFPSHGVALATMWRDKQIDYTRLTTTSKKGPHRESVYQPFWELTAAALRYTCKRLKLPLTAEAETRLLNQYRSLSAFPEARPVLAQLKARGIVTGILSNGDPDMLALAVKSANLGDVLDHVISVDPIQTYKTHPDAYALGEQATGHKAPQIAFVSCNSWDALAATWYGYHTLWVNRYALPFEELGTEPTLTGESLTDVWRFFD